MASRVLDVPAHVRTSPNVVIGNIDAFMDSYESGEQYKWYMKMIYTVKKNFPAIVEQECRTYANRDPV